MATGQSKPRLRGVAHLWRAENYSPPTPNPRRVTPGRGGPRHPWAVSSGRVKAANSTGGSGELSGQIYRWGLAAFSAAAGLIHLAAAYSHFGVSPLHGAFFIATGLFQVGTAALLAYQPGSWVLIATASVNASILAIWTMSRTIGIPLDPQAWTPEPLGMADATASFFELALVVGSLMLLAPSGRYMLEGSSPRKLSAPALLPAASVLAALTGLALFSAGSGEHGHGAGAHASSDIHGENAHASHGSQALTAAYWASPALGQERHPTGRTGELPKAPTQTRDARPQPLPVAPPAPRLRLPAVPAVNPPTVASQPEESHQHDQDSGGGHHEGAAH